MEGNQLKLKDAYKYCRKHSVRLEKDNLALIGAMYDNSCRYAPYKFFKVEFEDLGEDGPWYTLDYFGGQFREGASGECGDGNGGGTLEEAVENALEQFEQLTEVFFYEMKDIEIDIVAEYLVPDLISNLPESSAYWPDRKDEFEGICISALNKRNLIK
jgi:hypothetical protein